MKISIQQTIMASAVAFLMAGCAADDYTKPANVTKTGSGATSFEFDFSKINASAALTAASPTTSNPGGTTAVKWEVDSITSQTGIRPAVFTIGSAYPYAQAQLGYLKNPNYNETASGLGTPKAVTAKLKWTSGSADLTVNQKVGLVLAFKADLNDDGQDDTIAYGVQITHANTGTVLFIRKSDISSSLDNTDGTCVTGGSVGDMSAPSTAHTADITFTPASSPGMPVTISVSVDGGSPVTSVDVLNADMTNPSPCAGAGSDSPNARFKVGGTNVTLGALFFGGLLPVWSVQLLAQNGDNTTPITNASSPVINSVSIY
jgi:hypothetical protein